MTLLELNLLGGFEMTGPASPRLPTRKAEALLAYLALPAGRTHRRDHLASLLWGNSDEEGARHSLGQSLYLIQKSLHVDDTSPLVVDRRSVALDASRIEVDVARFEALAAQPTTEALQTAATLYQGEFLSGVYIDEAGFESWLLGEQRRLQEVALKVLEALLRHRLDADDTAAAIECANRLLTLDPVHEAVHRTLMRIYQKKDQRAAAIRQYQSCVEILRRELDVAPDGETIALYRDILADRAPPTPATGATRGHDDAASNTLPPSVKPSIAVIPFANRSGDVDQEFFADGITEDVITELSKYRWFFVIARNSSFTYKGTSVDAKRAARELGVRYVLEGSVRKHGDRIRITAQLIDAETGNHIWAEHYDRDLADLFAVQDEITEQIVTSIEPELGTAERERARRTRPEYLSAWERYQRGLWHHYRRTKVDELEAGRLFRAAIDLDPGFVLAHAALAEHYRRLIFHGWSTEPEETRRHALRSARLAVGADDRDAYAHLALGRILTMEGDRDAAIAELHEALELNPNLAHGHFALGYALNWFGRNREALSPLRRAIRQSPRDPQRSSFENMIGYTHLMLREYDEAIDWLKRSSRRRSDNAWPELGLAVAYIALDRMEEAHAAIRRALLIRSDLTVAAVADMLRPRHTENNDRYLDSLRTAGLPE
jgi:TolB-like protein/Tfp pilus assembly protein PilF